MKRNIPPVLLTEKRLGSLRDSVRTKSEPTLAAWVEVLRIAESELDRPAHVPEVWQVPWYYVQPEEHNRLKNVLRDDANASYAQALAYRITGETRFALSAIERLNSWSTQLKSMKTEEDSTLSFSNLFPAFIFAADILRRDAIWADSDKAAFCQFVRQKALPMNCMEKENNWGNWGLTLATACAAYLEDEDLLQQCASRWKFFIDTQIAEDGHLPHEVNRNEGRHGIWYSHFCLFPQTLAGEILRVNGIKVFDYESPEGRSLRDACDRLIPWIERPETFPYWKEEPERLVRVDYFSYFEILRVHWPDFRCDGLLKSARPMSAEHSAPFLTFTHGIELDSKG
tara:strand:- start:25609 stop:26631 length:1023 start_codon:yes stop_codon:yes gene_type:complete